jgi:hypothetical protein
MISLMDNLLKRENLDLRLSPYRVLPTGSDDGLVEFVPSAPLSRVLAEHRTIHKYLAQTQADAKGAWHGARARPRTPPQRHTQACVCVCLGGGGKPCCTSARAQRVTHPTCGGERGVHAAPLRHRHTHAACMLRTRAQVRLA